MIKITNLDEYTLTPAYDYFIVESMFQPNYFHNLNYELNFKIQIKKFHINLTVFASFNVGDVSYVAMINRILNGKDNL